MSKPPPPPDRPSRPGTASERPRVLVIEDNEDLAENVAELFAELGAETEVCHDAGSGLAAAAARGFHLAILDVRLPQGIRGVDLVPELKAAAPEGEVIVVTGNATLDTAIAAVREGVFAYVQKPFDPDDLMALGERALTQVQLRRERAALSRELGRSEALYRGVVETVDALILGIDAQRRVALANRAATAAVGRRMRELVGTAAHEAFAAGEEAARLARAIDRAAAGHSTRNLELELPGPGGAPRSIVWALTPLRTDAHEGPVVLATGTDVTERRALERRAAESEAMAAMGELTTGLAHEIRNPLNAANLQLELLARRARRTEGAPDIAESVTLVQDELRRLARLAEEFLNLARPKQLVRETVVLDELLEQAMQLHAPLIAQEGVALVVERSVNVPPIQADAARLRQVVNNLIANAIEAMRGQADRRLTLASRREGTSVAVEVRDTGPGIPPAVAGQLFRPFVTTKEAGTGLGLPIVKRIVELHGGTVQIGPSASGGTVARFTLPIVAPAVDR